MTSSLVTDGWRHQTSSPVFRPIVLSSRLPKNKKKRVRETRILRERNKYLVLRSTSLTTTNTISCTYYFTPTAVMLVFIGYHLEPETVFVLSRPLHTESVSLPSLLYTELQAREHKVLSIGSPIALVRACLPPFSCEVHKKYKTSPLPRPVCACYVMHVSQVSACVCACAYVSVYASVYARVYARVYPTRHLPSVVPLVGPLDPLDQHHATPP